MDTRPQLGWRKNHSCRSVRSVDCCQLSEKEVWGTRHVECGDACDRRREENEAPRVNAVPKGAARNRAHDEIT